MVKRLIFAILMFMPALYVMGHGDDNDSIAQSNAGESIAQKKVKGVRKKKDPDMQLECYWNYLTPHIVGVNGGVLGLHNNGLTITPNFNVYYGYTLSYLFTARASVGGIHQSINRQRLIDYESRNKFFLDFKLDAIFSISHLLHSHYQPPRLDYYVFFGPTSSFSSAISVYSVNDGIRAIEHGVKTGIGISCGAGLSYAFSAHVAINAEFRYGYGQSIFGIVSDNRNCESTMNVNIGCSYTLNRDRYFHRLKRKEKQ